MTEEYRSCDQLQLTVGAGDPLESAQQLSV